MTLSLDSAPRQPELPECLDALRAFAVEVQEALDRSQPINVALQLGALLRPVVRAAHAVLPATQLCTDKHSRALELALNHPGMCVEELRTPSVMMHAPGVPYSLELSRLILPLAAESATAMDRVVTLQSVSSVGISGLRASYDIYHYPMPSDTDGCQLTNTDQLVCGMRPVGVTGGEVDVYADCRGDFRPAVPPVELCRTLATAALELHAGLVVATA